MKEYSFYHKETGELHPTHFGSDDPKALALNTPADYIAILGKFDPNSQRWDLVKQEVIDCEPRPPDPEMLKQQARQQAQAEINALEQQQHRIVRELLLGEPNARENLAALEVKIATLRKEL